MRARITAIVALGCLAGALGSASPAAAFPVPVVGIYSGCLVVADAPLPGVVSLYFARVCEPGDQASGAGAYALGEVVGSGVVVDVLESSLGLTASAGGEHGGGISVVAAGLTCGPLALPCILRVGSNIGLLYEIANVSLDPANPKLRVLYVQVI